MDDHNSSPVPPLDRAPAPGARPGRRPAGGAGDMAGGGSRFRPVAKGYEAMTHFCMMAGGAAALAGYALFPAQAGWVKALHLDPMAFAIACGCLVCSLALYPGYRLARRQGVPDGASPKVFVVAVLGLTVIVAVAILLCWATKG